jgi:hypothetical protein
MDEMTLERLRDLSRGAVPQVEQAILAMRRGHGD